MDVVTRSWEALKTRGYVVAKDFLSPEELGMFRDEYASARATRSNNGNYNILHTSPRMMLRLERKLRAAGEEVFASAGVETDVTTMSFYFATERGVDFGWHQDHESFFLFQEHYHALNFYIPLIKPDPARTNLCVIPFDRLERAAPAQSKQFVGSGARSLNRIGQYTQVLDEEYGRDCTLPFDIEELKAVPELQAGDLLLLRGDVIHRTQDTLTERVAVSFRRTRSRSVISKARLLSGCSRKREMIGSNPEPYEMLLACFDECGRDDVTIGQALAYLGRQLAKKTSPAA